MYSQADRVEYLEGNSKSPQQAMVTGDCDGV